MLTEAYGNKPELCKKESTAEELVKLFCELADRAETIAERMKLKLGPIMTPEGPEEGCCGLDQTARIWSPLFNELRSKYYNIASSLSNMEETLSRTEL